MPRFVRSLLAVALAIAPLAVLLIARPALLPGLPSHVPAHWSGTTVDAIMPEQSLASGCFTIAVVATVVAAAAIVITPIPLLVRRWVTALAASAAAVACAMWVTTALSVYGKASPYDAVMGAGVLAVMAAIVYGVAPALLLPGRKQVRSQPG